MAVKKGYLFGLIILSLIGLFVGVYNNDNYANYSDPTAEAYEYVAKNSNVVVNDLDVFNVPDNWMTYLIYNDAFSLSLPNSLELRNEYDKYTQYLKKLNLSINNDIVIFQQKGLSERPSDKLYCRIMIQYFDGNDNDFLRSSEVEAFDIETISLFQEMIKGELGGFDIIGVPEYNWININGTKAIMISYRRSGVNDSTSVCTIYLLFNYNEMVKIITSYREREKEIWATDVGNIVKTFRWSN